MATANGLELGPEELALVFPFHVGFDQECRVVQRGTAIARLLPDLVPGAKLSDQFSLERPGVQCSFDAIAQNLGSFFLLRSSAQEQLMLRGQMLPLPKQQAMLFLGSPWITEVSALKKLGLKLSDFAPHESIADFLFVLQAKTTSLSDASHLADRLAEANQSLERRVEERTSELKDANVELQHEISERERVEEELRLAQKLEAIGQLAAGIAHEINTPLQYIGDNTRFVQLAFTRVIDAMAARDKLLASPSIPKDIAVSVARINKRARLDFLKKRVPGAIASTLDGVESVSGIVAAMKVFSHVGVGEEKSLENLNTALQSTLTISRNLWRHVADVETDLDSDLPPVPCYPGELNQVFLNCIVNAAHAIEDFQSEGGSKGKIRVRTSRADGCVLVAITDDGCGIPESARARVFDPFFTTKDIGRGTGQGLSISRAIVTDKHGGDISFETAVGKGTTFLIRIPLEERFATAADGE